MKFEANQAAYGDCPQCSSPLQLKFVGKNTFIGCTAYPKCDYSQSFNKNEVITLKVIDDSHCLECASQLAVKKGRYGMFIGCTNFPDCHFISTNQTTHDKPQYQPVGCPSCQSGKLHRKQNRFGKFFYACDNYPACKHVENDEPVAKVCPKCQVKMMLKKKKDVFICVNKKCKHVVNEEE